MINPFSIRSTIGIRKRALFLLLVVFVPLILLQAFTFYGWYKQAEQEELQSNLELARTVSKTFEAFISNVLSTQLAIGLAATSSPPLSNVSLLRIMQAAEERNPMLRSFTWISPEGIHLVTTNPKIASQKVGNWEDFSKGAAAGNWSVTPIFLSPWTKDRVFAISRPVRDSNGKLLGLVACTVVADKLDSLLAVKRSKDEGISLLDSKGMHVYRYPPGASAYTPEQSDWLKNYPEVGNALRGKEFAGPVLSKIRGGRRFVAFTPIQAIGWVAAASSGEGAIFAPMAQTLLPQAMVTLIVTLLAFGGAVFISRPLLAAILRLRDHALALGRGGMERINAEQNPEELKALASSMNEMAEMVREREIALRESEERFRTTLASIGDAVISTDLSGRVTFMNRIAQELTGWTEHEAKMKPVAEVFHIVNEQTRHMVENPVQKVLAEGNVVGLANHTVLLRQDGSEVPIDDSGAPIRDRDGRAIGVVLVFRDITDRKRAEEALQESEEKYRLLVQHAPSGIYEVDFIQKRFKTVNEAACKMLGLTVPEVLAMNPMDILDPDSRPAFLDRLRKAQAGEALSEAIEYKGRRKDGSELWGILHSKFKYLDGKIVGAFVVAHDITERKRAEEALRESEERNRKLVKFAPAAIYEMDLDGANFLSVNEAMCKILKYSREELLAIRPADLLDPESKSLFRERIRKELAGKEIGEVEYRVRRRDGQWVNAMVNVGAFTDIKGKPSRVVVIAYDITERKRMEEELRRSRDELELRVQERTEELAKSQMRLQQLAALLLLAQEKERKRVAVELHDGLLSELAAIKYLLEGNLILLDKGTPVAADGLRRVTDILAVTMKEARRIMNNLHPSVLDELGLIAAIGWFCEEYQKSYPHITVQKEIAVSEEDIAGGIRVVIFRVLQEALNNFSKHGNGNRAEVSLSKPEGILSFVIRDNGQGFDVEKAEKGLGLESMRERVELSGAVIDRWYSAKP